ncbi:MAG: Rab family GTPase [Promethearchaeota archaeon]
MYSRQYGEKQVDQDLISGFLTALSSFSVEVKGGAIKSLVMEDIRFIYKMGDHETLFVFCCDKDDLEEEVEERIEKVKNKFCEMFADKLKDWNGNLSYFKPFDDVIDDLIAIPLKIILVGEPGVGKSTILDFFPGDAILSFDDADTAIMKKQVEVEGIPYVNQIDFIKYDLETLMNEIRFHAEILKSADLVLLIVSSGASNVSRTKKQVKKLQSFVREGRLVCLANMQDMKDVALEPEFIQKNLGLKTYPFSAVQKDSKERFFNLIGEMLSNIFSSGSVTGEEADKEIENDDNKEK